jgi:four helix bundle protein
MFIGTFFEYRCGMTPQDLQDRCERFADAVVKLVQALIRDGTSQRLGGQLVDAATSVGANYRAARRARSDAEWLSKIGISIEEADESVYWLHRLLHGGYVERAAVNPLAREATELLLILGASRRTAQRRLRERRRGKRR